MPANLETEALLKKCHQEQVTRYWDELSENERKTLCEQVNEIEERVGCVALSELVGESSWTAEKQDNKEIEPANQKDLGVVGADSEETERWNTLGLQQIAESKAAVIVMAGGQGTRLGSTFPKGILGDSSVEGAKMDLPRGKSLFAFQAEKIKRLETLAKSAFPESNPSIAWLVMTSHATHDATKAYFEEQNYFGLESSQIRFFMQGRMPSLDQDGKILLAKKGDISMSPDGNGGIYTALQRSGTLDWMAARGVEWVQVYSVDNILIKVADPVFYGFCAARKVDAAAKTIPKKDASEAVGVFALRNQRYGVIEYSEIGAERAQETTPEGGLLYGAANPAIHCYSLKFLAGPALEYCKRGSIWHLAVKDIPTIEGPVKGIKLETFIFDAFAAADSFGLLQDTPKTASKDILSLHKSWLLAAGVQVGDRPVEISPLVSYAGEGLGDVAEKWELLTKGLGEGEPLVLDSKLMSSL